MHVIEVTPLKKGVQLESLSYFSKVSYEPGTLLSIPVRGKSITGIVVSATPVSAAKTALRSATFSLRKLPEQSEVQTLHRGFIETVDALATYYPAKRGAILYTLLPPDIRDGNAPYPTTPDVTHDQDSTPSILQTFQNDRFVYYRSHIREAFAHRGSVLLVVPTAADVAPIRAALETGIEERVLTFSSTQTKKQRTTNYEQFTDLSSAKLIITTPSFAFLDRCDLTHLIVEQCGSQYYTSKQRPYLDYVHALKLYAKVTKRSILLGDILPKSDDEVRRRDDRYLTADEHPKRIAFTSKFSVIEQTKPEKDVETFTIISPELITKIQNTIDAKSNVFLYAARRGMASLVMCGDCGYVFRCPDSGVPYTLFRTTKNGEEERWFLAQTSGRRVRAADTCPQCTSWRLRERGIGVQQVYDIVKKAFSDTPIILFDHTTATTHGRATALSKQFAEHRGGILIGTAMTTSYLPANVGMSAIVSYDAVRTVPSWRADEITLRLLLQLREKSEKEVVVQTRSEIDPLLECAKKGAVDSFYDEEIDLRRALKYPPFSTLILLTFQGTVAQTKDIESIVTKTLTDQPLQFYTYPLSNPNKTIRYGLLRIPTKDWPNQLLHAQLSALPPYVKVEINPDRIV